MADLGFLDGGRLAVREAELRSGRSQAGAWERDSCGRDYPLELEGEILPSFSCIERYRYRSTSGKKERRAFATDEHGFKRINAKKATEFSKIFDGIRASLSVWFCVHLWLNSFEFPGRRSDENREKLGELNHIEAIANATKQGTLPI